jgi:hypothetical protein
MAFHFYLLFCCEECYERGVSLLTIAIHGLRNKPFGPGGSTRRLHHFSFTRGANQDRRGRKGSIRRSAWYHRYRAIMIVANDNYAEVAVAA